MNFLVTTHLFTSPDPTQPNIAHWHRKAKFKLCKANNRPRDPGNGPKALLTLPGSGQRMVENRGGRSAAGKKFPMEGLKTLKSDFGPEKTMERLEAEIKAHKMTVFARINHAALAAGVGLDLRPTEVILFGNPRGGTPLMQAKQTMGIDLPLKALVWQDGSGQTWLSYNEPAWLAARHELTGIDGPITAMTNGLADIAARTVAG